METLLDRLAEMDLDRTALRLYPSRLCLRPAKVQDTILLRRPVCPIFGLCYCILVLPHGLFWELLLRGNSAASSIVEGIIFIFIINLFIIKIVSIDIRR